MERIASFSIDHTRLQPGMYLSRRDEKDAVVYFGPMGCQTGFYVLFDEAKLPLEGIVELLKRTFVEAAAWDREMPGQSPYECGNYRSLDVAVRRMEFYY